MPAEQIHLQIGAWPWEPDATSTHHVYDRHDRPTCGVIEQRGDRYLFDCVEGVVGDVSVWAYAPLTAADVAELTVAEGDAFAATVDMILRTRRITVAFARGDRIELAVEVDPEALAAGVDAGIVDAIVVALESGADAAAKLRALRPA
jgi:hypothetical protein